VPQLVAERLLGALELTVAALDLSVPQLVEALPERAADETGPRRVAIANVGTASEMAGELSKLDAFVPGGRISEYTCSSRSRRAMSWVYWEPKSMMRMPSWCWDTD